MKTIVSKGYGKITVELICPVQGHEAIMSNLSKEIIRMNREREKRGEKRLEYKIKADRG